MEAKQEAKSCISESDTISLLRNAEYRGPRIDPDEEYADSDTEFEDVPNQGILNDKNISVTVKRAGKTFARNSIDMDIKKHVNLLWKRFSKKQGLALKKIHLLCCLARGLSLNRLCDFDFVRNIVLSVVPDEFIEYAIDNRKTQFASFKQFIEKLLKYFKQTFSYEYIGKCHQSTLLGLFGSKLTASKSCYIQGIVSVMRVLKLNCRILIHFSHKATIPERCYTDNVPVKPKISKHEERDDSLMIIPFEMSSPECFSEWFEVYDRDQNSWTCVNPYSFKICKPAVIENLLTFSSRSLNINFVVCHVFAFDSGNRILDVTPRYAANSLHTSTRRERTPVEIETWLKEQLLEYRVDDNVTISELEELDYLSSSKFHPVPQTKTEITGHPLYVLASNVHKYEAVYPPDVKPIAKINNESVFLRRNVKEMHTEGKWNQEGRSVKPGEKPYKEVISHKTKNANTKSMSGLYGEWQTEIFKPPEVTDDQIPRNKFGNYEIFKPWMLPDGCCHIKKQGIGVIARRLGIGYAPAMVGWDFHGGTNHPVIDGIIVMEKHHENLELAYQEDINSMQINRKMKRSQQALRNWRHLIKAVSLAEKLRQRYL